MNDETKDEEREAERDDLTPDEAHRVGEFDDLRDKLDAIMERLDALDGRIGDVMERMTDTVAQMVENGAVVAENDDPATAIAEQAAEDLENLDFSI